MRNHKIPVIVSLFFMSTLVVGNALAASSSAISVVSQSPAAVSLLSSNNAGTYTINYTVYNNNLVTNKTPLKMQSVNLGAIPTNVLTASVQKNTCKGDLNSGDHCTFQALLKIKDALGQAQSVLLKPVVCASGGVCATPILGNTVWLLNSSIGMPQSIRVMPQPPLSADHLLVGDKMQYVAVEQFSKAAFPVTTLMHWSSSNPNVLSVDQQGVVKALKPGSASITARDMQANLQGSVTVHSKLVIGSHYKDGIAFHVAFSGDTGGLIAKRDAAMGVPWEKAKSACQKPWRLPTMAELAKIKTNAPLLIASKANLNTGKSHYYWSSTQSDAQHMSVLSLSPLNLDAQPVRSKMDPAYVRCVRTF